MSIREDSQSSLEPVLLNMSAKFDNNKSNPINNGMLNQEELESPTQAKIKIKLKKSLIGAHKFDSKARSKIQNSLPKLRSSVSNQ